MGIMWSTRLAGWPRVPPICTPLWCMDVDFNSFLYAPIKSISSIYLFIFLLSWSGDVSFREILRKTTNIITSIPTPPKCLLNAFGQSYIFLKFQKRLLFFSFYIEGNICGQVSIVDFVDVREGRGPGGRGPGQAVSQQEGEAKFKRYHVTTVDDEGSLI